MSKYNALDFSFKFRSYFRGLIPSFQYLKGYQQIHIHWAYFFIEIYWFKAVRSK